MRKSACSCTLLPGHSGGPRHTSRSWYGLGICPTQNFAPRGQFDKQKIFSLIDIGPKVMKLEQKDGGMDWKDHAKIDGEMDLKEQKEQHKEIVDQRTGSRLTGLPGRGLQWKLVPEAFQKFQNQNVPRLDCENWGWSRVVVEHSRAQIPHQMHHRGRQGGPLQFLPQPLQQSHRIDGRVRASLHIGFLLKMSMIAMFVSLFRKKKKKEKMKPMFQYAEASRKFSQISLVNIFPGSMTSANSVASERIFRQWWCFQFVFLIFLGSFLELLPI